VRNSLQLITLILASSFFSLATDRAVITGTVSDNLGKPLKDATVMVWHAGVKKGYSTYCPSCYRDCGKRTMTDAAGSFTIVNLDPELWFELLVVRDGYTPTFIEKVDPAIAGPRAVSLTQRATVNDPTRVVRGRVVDSHGRALRDAVVLPEGVTTQINGGNHSIYGTIKGLDPIAVTDSRGRFDLAYSQEASGMMLQVEARGMATKLVAVPTGAKRQTITVFDGAAIRGRLLNQGKPVAGAEVGLIAQDKGGFGDNLKIVGNPYPEVRIGTQDDGSFLIPNVPVPVAWYVYAKMESIASLGATNPVETSTVHNGELLNVDDLEIVPGHQLRGRVTLSDGAGIPDGMRITIAPDRVWDSQTVLIGPDGTFGFRSLPTGKYEIFPSVRGYRLQNKQRTIEIIIDKDIDTFALVLEPAS
jgi:hypothetical protein